MTLDSPCWTGPDGVPWKMHTALANATRRNLWITVPDQYDDAAVEELAVLVTSRLDPSLVLYVEFSNEPWNSDPAYPQHGRMRDLAAADPTITATNDVGKVAQWYARRAVQVARAFRRPADLAGTDVRPVLAGQATQPAFLRAGLSFLTSLGIDPAVEFHGLAIAPYVTLPAALDTPVLTLNGLFEGLDINLTTRTMPGVAQHAALAKAAGLALLAYEGGQGLVCRRGSVVTNQALKAMAQVDPRMGALHRKLAAAWSEAGGGLFCWFCLASAWEPTGRDWWGLRPGQVGPAPAKWDAVAELAAAGM